MNEFYLLIDRGDGPKVEPLYGVPRFPDAPDTDHDWGMAFFQTLFTGRTQRPKRRVTPRVAAPTGPFKKRTGPPPLPGQRNALHNLDYLGTGARFQSGRNIQFGPRTGAPVGEWIDVVSTWVLRTRFDPYPNSTAGDWRVEFLDGFACNYPNTPGSVFTDFFNSSSKGAFIYYRCKVNKRFYIEEKDAFRKPDQKQLFLRDVSPMEGSRQAERAFIEGEL